MSKLLTATIHWLNMVQSDDKMPPLYPGMDVFSDARWTNMVKHVRREWKEYLYVD
jgi:hypothetical protein